MVNKKCTKILVILALVVILLLVSYCILTKYTVKISPIINTPTKITNNTYVAKKLETFLSENPELQERIQELKLSSQNLTNSEFLSDIFEIVELVNNIANKN